ncbi:MAG TPA: O-methyltransferase [Solirubrobacterales bacterium]|jgi:hypothetical protein|nr:O-methyltransferase [Solirubrobacterales bacterium]
MIESERPRLPDAPYAFRPAKRIQRIMFCDALRALRSLRPIEQYQYLGFGHWQFVDFELMRREVGVRQMISIERNSNLRARFEENTPFEEITLLFADAYEALQSDEVDLEQPTVAWLDYTSKLDLRALKLLVEQLPGGSVVAATFNCRPDREDTRLEALEGIGVEVPGDIAEDDLDREGLPKVLRRILVEQLGATAQGRGDGAALHQFMFLRYEDGAPMMFWAALLADETIDPSAALKQLSRCEQFRDGDDFLDISVPFLSTREVLELNKDIRAGSPPSIRGVEREDCEAYGRLHRWYPPVPLPF